MLEKNFAELCNGSTTDSGHIISNRGFDTRKLFEKFPKVTLKRDDLSLVQFCINKDNK